MASPHDRLRRAAMRRIERKNERRAGIGHATEPGWPVSVGGSLDGLERWLSRHGTRDDLIKAEETTIRTEAAMRSIIAGRKVEDVPLPVLQGEVPELEGEVDAARE